MFSTTIKKEWWDKKMQQYEQKGYFYEYKEHKPFWNKRIENLKLPADAVFLVGSVPHRAKIIEITCITMFDAPIEIIAFFLFSTIHKQTAEEFKNSKVWVLKCEDVSGEREVYTSDEKEIYRKFDHAQKELDKEREEEDEMR